jgi:putative transposase
MRFAKGEFYHIYNRGVEGRDIFLDDYDYKRFMHGLSAFNVDALVRLRDDIKTDHVSAEYKLASVLSYVLMKNHVHLLVRCNGEARLSQFLQKLFGGYTMYFNVKYSRKGVLFQGKSKSKHIDTLRI